MSHANYRDRLASAHDTDCVAVQETDTEDERHVPAAPLIKLLVDAVIDSPAIDAQLTRGNSPEAYTLSTRAGAERRLSATSIHLLECTTLL